MEYINLCCIHYILYRLEKFGELIDNDCSYIILRERLEDVLDVVESVKAMMEKKAGVI